MVELVSRVASTFLDGCLLRGMTDLNHGQETDMKQVNLVDAKAHLGNRSREPPAAVRSCGGIVF